MKPVDGVERRQRRSALSSPPPAMAWVLGVALVGAVLLVATAFALYERGERLNSERQRSELLARVLEDHATRSFDTATLALSSLADQLSRSTVDDGHSLGSALQQAMFGLPLLRSVAVLDSQGTVLASTVPAERGLRIDLQRLGPPPPPGQNASGPFVAARGLAGLAGASGRNPVAAPPGVGFVPLQRWAANAAGQPRLLLALLNPDAIANYQEQALGGLARAALLARFDGQALAATAAAQVTPGQSLAALPVFQRWLPGTEIGTYTGPGASGDGRLVAFRASRNWPLVVLVEMAPEDALLTWRRDLRWLLATCGGMVLVIIGLSAVLHRSLRAREAARSQRDSAQAEVALRERELSVIVKSVQELLFRTDAQGRLSFVNARWQAASGHPEAQALGRPLAELVRPESAAAAAALFEPGGAAGVRSAQLLMGPEDAVLHFAVAVAPLRSGGEIVGYAGSAMDVTEQHKAQAQALLRAQLAFTELLLQVMPLPLSILDPQGRYVSVNRAWEDFTGRRRAAVLGQPAGLDLPDAEAQMHRAHDEALLARGGQLRYDATALNREGERRDLAITKAAVPGEDGQPAGILVAFMDVTEFRQAERATREARDAAEDASRAKTEFVANISHELRTPLQSIIGFSELGQMRSGTQARLGAMFGDIHAAGQRMLALVNDLLDVAKIESTVGTFHLERADVRSLVRDVVGELQPLLAARRLAVDLRLSEGPLVAKVDPTRFQQVVRNVLANAIRFSPVGETLAIHGDIDAADHRIHIVVSDRGPGIPPAELDKIFEAFVQSSKTKDGSGGTGLGLAICRKIIEAHGGEIRASNNAGGGSSFHILLPARSFGDTVTAV